MNSGSGAVGSPGTVGVLTFHRCINYGSYWQARCLVEGLRSLGYDAVLLDHHAARITAAEYRCALQPTLPARTAREDLPRYAAKTRLFLQAFDQLPLSRTFALDAPHEAERVSTVVIGSDEVWNFSHPWYGWHPTFFGDGLNAARVVSYAASFGNHDAERGIHPDWSAKLRRLDAVSVRDANARALVVEATGVEPALVLDPVLQFANRLPPIAEGDEVIVYGHGFPDWFSSRVRAWADAGGHRLVSIGYRNDWAHEQRIVVGPEEFAATVARARAVATNFFHGSVFALAYGKPFVAAPSGYRMNKLRDLTAKLGAEPHLMREDVTEADMAARLDAPLDPAISARIADLRTSSAAYLRAALG